MKQLLILSGKGGTGKTTIASSFIKLSDVDAYADCDVDAPNLHLISSPDCKADIADYFGMDKAYIDQNTCIKCGLCMESCRFSAILFSDKYKVDSNACEGCGVCEYVCPMAAISLNKDIAGKLSLYKNEKVFSTAKLKMGSGTSGLLVSQVKKRLINNSNSDFAIIDGSPGIGCPVIASISGVDHVLIVSEPSISGISDMKRIIDTASKFSVRTSVCINKYDTNLERSKDIEVYCKLHNIDFVGRISYDKDILDMQNKRKNIIDKDCKSSNEIKTVYNNILKLLDYKGDGIYEDSGSK